MATDTAMLSRQSCLPKRIEMLSLSEELRSVLRFPVAALLAALSPAVLAETAWFQTSLFASETFTNNADASKSGRSDWITEISPGISAHRTSGHATGSFEARFRNIVYANEGSRNDSFVTLTGKGSLELIDDSLFIDVRSSVGRNNQSNFRGRSQWDSQNTDQESEVRYVSVSPRWVGHIGKGDVEFSMKYDGEALSYGSDMSNQRSGTFRGKLFDPTAGERFSWSLDYRNSDSGYRNEGQKDVTDTRLTGTLIFKATSNVALRAVIGTENSNYSGQDDSGTTTGYGFNWRPTPRTTIDGLFEKHVYGDTFDVRFSHRRPLSAWDLRLSRDVSSAYQSATDSLGSYYYNLFSTSLISQIPDPVERDQAVREIMKALGISTAGAFGNLATNAFFVERRIQAGVSLIGARHTLALSAYRSDREKTSNDLATNPSDDFAAHDSIESSGATLSLTHKLTPTSGLNGSLFWSSSEGSGGGASQSRRSKGLVLAYNKQLGPKSFASINFRRETASGDDEFTESSVTASLSRAF